MKPSAKTTLELGSNIAPTYAQTKVRKFFANYRGNTSFFAGETIRFEFFNKSLSFGEPVYYSQRSKKQLQLHCPKSESISIHCELKEANWNDSFNIACLNGRLEQNLFEGSSLLNSGSRVLRMICGDSDGSPATLKHKIAIFGKSSE